MEPLSAPDPAQAALAPRDVWETVLASLDVGIVLEDANGHALACNESAQRILGLTRDQLTGVEPLDPAWSTIHEDGWPLPPAARPAAMALLSGRPHKGMTFGVKHPGGRVTWVTANAHPLFEPDGDAPYAVATSYADVTESRAADEAQRRNDDRFRSVIEYSSDVVTIFDEQGRQTYESPSVERVLGYAPGELEEGTARLALVHPEDTSAVLGALGSLVGRPGASVSVEYRIRARDGDWRIVESIASNRLHDPAVLGFVINTRDLTEHRREQAALRATTSRLTNLVQNLKAGVLVEDEERRIALANADLCAIFGIDAPPNVLVGADCAAAAGRMSGLLAEPDRFTARIDALIAAREPVIGEEVAFADGRTFERDYIPISVEGANRGHLWLYRDISARKASEREAARARDEAIRASRVKSEFLATMSHEIRTPMNGVIGTIELLMDSRLSPDQRELAAVVRDSAYGLLSIIDDVLDLSKIEAEKLEPKEVDFDLATTVEGVVDVLLSASRKKGLFLTSYVDPRVTGTLRGDAQWLRQVLVNLVGNAVKFTDSGEVHLRAQLESATGRGATIRFSVADDGPGIPESARERLFEPFAQLDSTSARHHGGTGLGLSICQRLVRLMGGEVELESELGHGAEFSFTLTFLRKASAPVPRFTRDLRVLLIEACDAAARIVLDYLGAWGVAADHAHDSTMGRKLCAEGEPYDVAIVGTSIDSPVVELAAGLSGASEFVLLKEVAHDVALDGQTPAPFAAELSKPVKRGRLFEAIAAAADPASLPRRRRDEATRTAAHPVSGAHVLVADDNEVNRELMVRQLAKLGVRAEAVATGDEAIRAVRDGRYDAVLMDCQMPEVDGLDAARAIRSGELGDERVPIVAVTASAMSNELAAPLAAGMDACLTKPFSTAQLSEALAEVLAVRGPVDVAALARLGADVGDEDAVRRVATIFVDGLPDLRASLDRARRDADDDELRRLGHRLRASSATFGAHRLAKLAAFLESHGTPELVDAIDRESRRVADRLRAELTR